MSDKVVQQAAPTKALIITADDFGYCPQRNKGIVESFLKGAVTRSSLMVNAVAAENAVQLAKEHKIPIGLHFNITEGFPLSSPEHVTSLLNDQGTFYGLMHFRDHLKPGKINPEEVRLELKAQIERFQKLTGHLPLYVDGHQHVHVVPGVSEPFADTLAQYGNCETRLPVENLADCDWVEPFLAGLFKLVVQQSLDAKSIYIKHGIRFPDAYFGMVTMGAYMTADRLQQGLLDAYASINKQEAKTGATAQQEATWTCELMVHPGYPSSSTLGGVGEGPDEFSQSHDRLYEVGIITSREMLTFYQEHRIKLWPSLQSLSK